MNRKKFVPCIYLYQKHAVAGFDDTKTVISMNPVKLAGFYSDNGADELLVFDLSTGDAEHEEALDIIKAICNTVEMPVIGAGHVKRVEDIKKLRYAGCKKAANHCVPGNRKAQPPTRKPENPVAPAFAAAGSQYPAGLAPRPS